MRLQSSAVAAGEDTGVGHDPMVGVSLPPGFHTATQLFHLFPPVLVTWSTLLGPHLLPIHQNKPAQAMQQ